MAVLEEKRRETLFRSYLADCFYLQGEGKMPGERWADLLTKQVDNRTGDEIVIDVLKSTGLWKEGGASV